MKKLKIIILGFIVGSVTILQMAWGDISKDHTWADGEVLTAALLNANEDELYTTINDIDGTLLSTSIAITTSGTCNFTGTFKLGGTTIAPTAAELNYVDGVTSAIQTQLDGKSATTGNASIVTIGTITTGGWAATAIPVAYGGTGATTAAAALTNLSVPTGMIVLWYGTVASIPSGWALCNGSNGTPDLRNRFIVGADADSGGVAKTTVTGSATQSGGSVTIAEANLPSHTHTGPSHTHAAGTLTGGAHTHGFKFSSGTTGAYLSATHSDDGTVTQNTESGGTVAVTGSTAADGTGASGAIGSGTAYTQPYYALCYIMKL